MHLRGLTVPVDNLLVFNSGDFGNYGNFGNFCRARTAHARTTACDKVFMVVSTRVHFH
jgi:hypothetical protein